MKMNFGKLTQYYIIMMTIDYNVNEMVLKGVNGGEMNGQ